MSLLLSQVGAPPAAPTFAPRQVRPVTVDDGSIEIRGVIRLGAFVAAVAAVAMFAPAIIRPTTPIETAPVQSGQVRTATPPRTIAFPIERPVTLDEPTTPPGRIATGWAVTTAPVVVVWSPSTQRVTLPELDAIPGRITPGWQVTAAAPATIWAPPLRSPQLDTPATATGRVQTAPLPPRAWVPAHTRAATLDDRPTLLGRIVAPIVQHIRVALRITPTHPVDQVASRAGQVSAGVTVTVATGPSTPIDIVRVDTPNVVTSLRIDVTGTVRVPNMSTSAIAPNVAAAVAVPNLVTAIAEPNRVERIAMVATRTGTMTPHQTTTITAANTTTHTANPEGIE